MQIEYRPCFEEEFLARQDSWLEGVDPKVLALSVTELHDMGLLSTRTWNSLIAANVRSVRDLARIPDDKLLKNMRNFGRLSLKDVRFALARLGFTRPISEVLWNGGIPDHHQNWAALLNPSSRKRKAMDTLAKRAVACRHWRWLPGMLMTDGVSVSLRVYCNGEKLMATPNVQTWTRAVEVAEDSEFLPALTDPATLGCLLALVREAWGCRTAYLTHNDGSWLVIRRDPLALSLCKPQESEAAALVAALETAP